MAHNLMFDAATGRHAYAGERPAWHNLGQVVNHVMTWEEATTQAMLDYTVSKVQLSSPFDGSPIDAWGIFRDDSHAFLGAVGDQYTVIQNRYAFQFVDALLEQDDQAHYVSAGALGKGERIWCLARVNGDIQIAGTDDKHETYLLFTTSHDGSLAATCKLTSVRVVCQNTLTSALNSFGAYLRTKHTAQAQVRMDAARALMQNVTIGIKELEEKFNILAGRKVTQETFVTVMKRLFGDWEEKSKLGQNVTKTTNKILEIAKLYESNDHDAIPEIRGTAYNLLNSITEYTDHQASFRASGDRKELAPQVIRAQNAMFGNGANLKELALDVILAETASAPTITRPTMYAMQPPSAWTMGGMEN